MSELAPFYRLLEQFQDRNVVSVDRAHNLFMVGALLSKKPMEVLELGVGTGYLTVSIVYALSYNKRGRLTSVDNWLDWDGKEPPHVPQFRQAGVNVVTMGEEEFVRQAPTDGWDFLISDADHFHSHTWIDQHLRIVKDGGFLFFHDTHTPAFFPGLATIEGQLKARGLFCLHFHENSRPDEHCDRGWLFAVNRK